MLLAAAACAPCCLYNWRLAVAEDGTNHGLSALDSADIEAGLSSGGGQRSGGAASAATTGGGSESVGGEGVRNRGG